MFSYFSKELVVVVLSEELNAIGCIEVMETRKRTASTSHFDFDLDLRF